MNKKKDLLSNILASVPYLANVNDQCDEAIKLNTIVADQILEVLLSNPSRKDKQ